MWHHLHIGHFDHQALREHKLVVLKSLDMTSAWKLFKDLGGTIDDDNGALIDGERFFVDKGGYFVCFSPLRYSKAVEFIHQLANQTGCDIATVEGGGISSPDAFLEGRLKPPAIAQVAAKSA